MLPKLFKSNFNKKTLCKYSLSGNNLSSSQKRISEVCNKISKSENEIFELYGSSDWIFNKEKEFSSFFASSNTQFFPTGAMAQQVAYLAFFLTHNIDRKQRLIALQENSQLRSNEFFAFQSIHGISEIIFNDLNTTFIATLPEYTFLIIEIPNRNQPQYIPTLQSLQEVHKLAKTKKIHLHLDGARLIEMMGSYGKQLCLDYLKHFDTAYISLYKALNSIHGAALLSPKFMRNDIIKLRRSLGGELKDFSFQYLFQQRSLPNAITESKTWHNNAVKIASRLSSIKGITILPQIPIANFFHVYFDLPASTMYAWRNQIADMYSVWMFSFFKDISASKCWAEIMIYDAYTNISTTTFDKILKNLTNLLMQQSN